jgi:hypothetical protein
MNNENNSFQIVSLKDNLSGEVRIKVRRRKMNIIIAIKFSKINIFIF